MRDFHSCQIVSYPLLCNMTTENFPLSFENEQILNKIDDEKSSMMSPIKTFSNFVPLPFTAAANKQKFSHFCLDLPL